MIEPAPPPVGGVPDHRAAPLLGAQYSVGLPGVRDGVGVAVALHLVTLVGAERLGHRCSDLAVVAAGQEPALAFEPVRERAGQGAEHVRRVGEADGPARDGLRETGEEQHMGEPEGVAQLVVHAHGLVRWPGGGRVDTGGVTLPGGEGLLLDDRFDAQLPQDGGDVAGGAQVQTAHQDSTVCSERRVQLVPGFCRPAGGVVERRHSHRRGHARSLFRSER